MQATFKDYEASKAILDRVRGTVQQALESDRENRMLRQQQQLQGIIGSIAKRKQLSLQSLAFLADVCGKLDLKQAGQDVCQRILADLETAKGSDEKSDRYATKARFQLAGLLQTQKKYDEAAKHLEVLSTAHPNSLEVLLKKGEVLQDWAGVDPKHYEECVAHWTRTRLLLARVRPRPKEYYQVVYNTAFCLAEQATRGNNPAKAQQAEQLLKSTLVTDAKLDGPETVKKYQALLTRLQSTAASPSTPAKSSK